MTRINVANRKTEVRNSQARNLDVRKSVAWGRAVRNNAGPLIFAAVLIVCSLAVGCSSEKPQPITSNNPAPMAQPANTMAANPAPAALPEAKPAPKKVVHKRPATLTYTDKTYGVSFAYPRRYAIETGDAAKELLVSSPLPMNFVQPGGVALAAVELPETGFINTDFSSAFFDVSVNNTLTADQCAAFSVPQATPTTSATDAEAKQPAATTDAQSPKLLLGDLEAHSAEAVSGEGTRQADSKYFHIFQNGACYEFALNLTTNGQASDGTLKHVDRDKVFARLETILSTVKFEAAATEAKSAEQQAEPKMEMDGPKTSEVKSDDAKANEAKVNDAKTAATTTEEVKPGDAQPGDKSGENSDSAVSSPAKVDEGNSDAAKVAAASGDSAQPVAAAASTTQDPQPPHQ